MTSPDRSYIEWAERLDGDRVRRILSAEKCDTAFLKWLSPNDNTKNQIYVGSDLAEVSMLPSGEVRAQEGTSAKKGGEGRPIYWASLDFAWVTPDGLSPAAEPKLIYYPQYPEVRLSGLLRGASGGPNELLDPLRMGRDPGRVLVIGVDTSAGRLIGILLPHSSPATREFSELDLPVRGVFRELAIGERGVHPPSRPEANEVDASGAPPAPHEVANRDPLNSALCRIHRKGWIDGCKLTNEGPVAYTASNGGGFTLEAELGVLPNGVAAPDFLGWEVKQHDVNELANPKHRQVTLMTPEPDGGFYVELGAVPFVHRWGHEKAGNPGRWDFSGRHTVASPNPRTNLELTLVGVDASMRPTSSDGCLALVHRQTEVIAASWSFTKLLNHWKQKHAAAVYVPSEKRTITTADGADVTQYRYGGSVLLGEGTTFSLLLASFASGAVSYDPGIHVDLGANGRWSPKKRNQFRINSKNLGTLYNSATTVNVCGPEPTA